MYLLSTFCLVPFFINNRIILPVFKVSIIILFTLAISTANVQSILFYKNIPEFFDIFVQKLISNKQKKNAYKILIFLSLMGLWVQ